MKKTVAMLTLFLAAHSAPASPNILWIYVDDMSDWLGCYGDSTVPTPLWWVNRGRSGHKR